MMVVVLKSSCSGYSMIVCLGNGDCGFLSA